ncbi:Dicer-like protein 1 [Vanrija pseudolonga]|uniref:Dicer-like protein 1 n=1 Tax=Vanrija pseudolonga TaxID=143232 RepID=A0AAF1BG09_9TREE|nr:Dicer-like protein 1 [Vanrija pseudolonga]
MSKRNSPAGTDSPSKRARPLSIQKSRLVTTQQPHPRVTPQNATTLLSLYVGSLRNNLSVHNARYTFEGSAPNGVEGHQKCTVLLPFNSPVREATSDDFFPNKQGAKRSAAINAINALIAAGEISQELIPTPANPTKKGPPGQAQESNGHNASTPIDNGGPKPIVPAKPPPTSGEDEYPYYASPKFWAECPPVSSAEKLYTAVITVAFDDPHATELAGECRPLLLLTSRPLPGLDISNKRASPIELDITQFGFATTAILSAAQPITVDEGQVDRAFEFTRRLLRATLNKGLDGEIEETRYLVVPLRRGLEPTPNITADDIAWDEVNRIEGELFTPIDLDDRTALLQQLEDAVISTPNNEFGRRFFAVGLRTELSPRSKVPGKETTFWQEKLEAIGKGWQLGEAESLKYPNQPLLEGDHYIGPKNGGLIGSVWQGPKCRGHILIPELYTRHFLNASVLRTASILPAMLTELEDELLADEMNEEFFNGALKTSLAREATTCPGSRPFAGQAALNYERLELLGDTILKLIVTVDTYISSSSWHGTEGDMTDLRHRMVSNKALQASLIKAGIVPYIRMTVRRGRAFLPPGWIVENSIGLVEATPTTQTLGDKSVADVAEALIGAAYLSNGRSIQAAIDAMHALCVPIKLRQWSQLAEFTRDKTAVGRPLTLLGYKFKHPAEGRIIMVRGWFRTPSRAHTAQSHTNDPVGKSQFERCEFLGDGLIDYLTVDEIYHSHPDLGPAPMTHMKHSRVSNAAFGAFLVFSGLSDQFTEMDKPTMLQLQKVERELKKAKDAADAERAAGKQNHEFWATVRQHKWVGDTVEAVFGAILEDSGFDLEVARKLYDEYLRPFVDLYAVPPIAHSNHPKSVLLELLAKEGCQGYTIDRLGEVPGKSQVYAASVSIHGTVMARAEGPSPDVAIRIACDRAFKPVKARLDKLCTCGKT